MRWTLLLLAFNLAAQDDAAERRRRMREEFVKRNPPRDSIGVTALSDGATYKNEEGGLYPGGSNTMPAAHRNRGLDLARSIRPLDADGRASDAGKVVMVSTGMSNTTQESQAFAKLLAESAVNPRFLFVDCAQGGQTAQVTANPQANYWKVAEERLAGAGVTANQVQVAWLKQANAGPTAPFPQEARRLHRDIVMTLHNLHAKYTNLKIVYLSSRIYAGYASTPLNPEPHAFETGFAVKWTVAAQIAGDPELAPHRAPWIAWGPYLWADGVKGRKPGSLTWEREDLAEDGTHPAPSGRIKVARLLFEFLRDEPTARTWFLPR